jgi:hypothetical protein
MRKIIFLLTLSLGLTLGSFAQSTKTGDFNIGVYGAQPLNNMNSLLNTGIGGSVKYEYYLQRGLNLTLESGFESFGIKTKLQNAFVPSTVNYVPIKLGAKYFLVKGFYAEGQAGAVIYCQHGGGDALDASGGIGYAFKKGFEIGIRYEQWHQVPEKHITGDYGISGPFEYPGKFGQFALRLAEWF